MAKHYFDLEQFTHSLINDCGYNAQDNESKRQFSIMIQQRLGEEILETVINSLYEYEIKLFHKILEDHPELDEMDALMMIAPNISGLGEKLERAIQALYREIVLEAKELAEALSS